MKRILSAALCCAPLAAPAADWSNDDKLMLGAALTLTAVDWAQTRQIAKHPDYFRETNPLLGAHPTVLQVNRYFIAASLTEVAVALAVPAAYRKAVLGGIIGLELSAVITNHQLGVRMRFHEKQPEAAPPPTPQATFGPMLRPQ